MPEFIDKIEQRKSFDFSVLKTVTTQWQTASHFPGLADRIVDDITPLPEDGMDFDERRENAKRKALRELLSRDEYVGMGRLDGDEVSHSLAEAMGIVDKASVEHEALTTLLHVYRIQRSLAWPKQEVADPRNIAFRILNPVRRRRR